MIDLYICGNTAVIFVSQDGFTIFECKILGINLNKV